MKPSVMPARCPFWLFFVLILVASLAGAAIGAWFGMLISEVT